jgi:hypothetical protein
VVQVTLRAFLNPDVVDDAEESAEDGADPS